MSDSVNTRPAGGRKPRDPNAPKQVRKPAGPRVVYAIVQVLDDKGEPMEIARGNIKVVSFEKNAEQVLQKIESGSIPHALYLRGEVPAGR